MSLLSDFAAAMGAQALRIIGGEPLTIGGSDPMQVISDTVEDSREYSEIGYEPEQRATLIVPRTAFDAACPLSSDQYLGKAARFQSRDFRVATIRRGRAFVEVVLTSKSRSS
jgi:hypothetical protein